MRTDVRVLEVGEYRTRQGVQLRLELRRSRLGAWELELLDVADDRRIARRFTSEAEAREATEQAYRCGVPFGWWTILRAADYQSASA